MTQQAQAEELLVAKGIDYELIDAGHGDNRDIRNAMFEISGHNNTYPQVFIRYGGLLFFVGLFDKLEALNEADGLPPEMLRQIQAQDPTYQTFSEIFSVVGRVDD